MSWIVGTVGLALLLALPVHAQSGLGLTSLPLKSTLGDIPSAPIPTDQNGNPIQPSPPTEAELAAERREQERRIASQRAEDDRQAAEAARRAADDSRATAQLAEQKKFHDRLMTAVYVGLAIVALAVGSRLFKHE